MEDGTAAEWDVHQRQNGPDTPGDEASWTTVAKADKGKGKAKQQQHPGSNTSKVGAQNGLSAGHRRNKRRLGKWQGTAWQAPQVQKQHSKTPKLIDDDDGNEGQAEWRTLQPAKAFVRVPTDILLAGQEWTLYRLAKEHSTHVAVQQRVAPSPNTQTYGIWGAGKDAEETRKAIVAWLEEMMGPRKSDRAGTFAKLASMTPALRERAEKRWKREVQRQRFRQHPPLDMSFGAIGTFHWPVNEYPPHEILGPNCEALDPVRMDCASYIVWKNNAFEIMGKDAEKVKTALMRLRQTVFQIAAKQTVPTRMHFLHWPHDSRCETVRLEEYEQPRQLSGPVDLEINQHPSVLGVGVRPEEPAGYAAAKSLAREHNVYSAILETINKLPYFRGHINLRFHFGRFLATQYMLPENGEYVLEDYESMMEESQFQGMITEELGDTEMEQSALATLQGATSFLMPLGPVTTKLSEVKPIYTATFTFADKLGDLCLTKSWQAAEDYGSTTLDFENVSEKWTRLDRDTGTISSLVDITLTDLSTSFGWAFTLDAAQPVDHQRLESPLIDFACNVKVDAAAALRQATDKPFVKFNAYVPETVLKSVEQRITYAYGMQDVDYNVELTRFQKFIYPGRNIGSVTPSSAPQTRIFESRWGVSVHRMEWDTLFAENEQLRVGQKASWSSESERWFPKSWDGEEEADASRYFSDMVARLDKLGDLLRSGARVEDLLGGMSVG